jgi:hypothetical protein
VVVTAGPKAPRAARRVWRSIPRAGVLLAGIVFMPPQSIGNSLLHSGNQLSAVEELAREPQLRGIQPARSGSEFGVKAGSQYRTNFPFPPATAGLSPAQTYGFSWSLVGLGEAQGSDPVIGAALASAVSSGNEQFGVSASSADRLVGAVGPEAVARAVCEQVPQQLQASGLYWNDHSVGGPPVRFAASVSTDPIRGPSGDPANLRWPGPVGEWCRPPALPFGDSSPLANRAFWTPIVFVLLGVAVLWLSRGVRLPH